MKHKKILLGSMSTVLAVATPIATVVSCGTVTISGEANIESAIKYAKENATKWNNDNNKWGATGRNPFGYALGHVAKDVIDQLGKQAPAFKAIAAKLAKTMKLNGDESFYDLLGEKIVDEVLNDKTIDDGTGQGFLSINEFLQKNINPIFQNQMMQMMLKLWKVIESGKNPFKQKIDPTTNKPMQSIADVESGAEHLDLKTYWDPIQDEKQYTNFPADKKLQNIFEDGIKAKIVLGVIVPVIPGVLGIIPATTLTNFVRGLFTVIKPLIVKSNIDHNDIQKMIEELQGKKIKIGIEAFGVKKSFTSKTINLPKKITDTLKSSKPDIATILTAVRDEILAPVKGWNQTDSIMEMMIKKSKKDAAKAKKNGSGKKQTQANADPTQNIIETLKTHLTSDVLESLEDVIKLINNISTNTKITNPKPFAFENPKTINNLIEIVKSVSKEYGEVAEAAMKTLSGVANLYR